MKTKNGAPGCHAPAGGTARLAHHSEQTKRALTHRLARIEGQIRGVARMITEDQYCDNVLAQIASVEAALNGVRRQLLEAHVRGCIVDGLKEGRAGVVEELMTTIGRMTR